MLSLALYEHQLKAIEKLKNGSILCGGVGSGKSRAAIAYYFLKILEGGLCINGDGLYSKPKNVVDLYVITTARKRDTLEWEKELPPFLLSTDSDISICGIKVTIDSWNNIKKYIGVKSTFFIFDEQRVIGYGAWTKSFLRITANNKWILLSATPGDTWLDYMPVFIANGFYRNKTDFMQKHVILSRYTKYQKVDRYVNTKYLIKYRDSILVDMDFERTTQQIHNNILVDYNRLSYKVVMRDKWNIFEDAPCKSVSEVCSVLRKIVNSDISRQEAFMELMIKHNKIIVFYNFNYERDILLDIASKEGIVCAQWNGKIHQPIPSTERWLYLVQYMAGSEGWNCVETDTMVFYSENYSYRIMIQAAGRIDRMNTTYHTLYYYHFKTNSSIDLAISRCLKQKKNFNEGKFISFKQS